MSGYDVCMRADARRNRDALLAAAREVFAESGLDAPLDLVIQRAGVGRGTLYRRFPTREDLFRAVHEDNLDVLERAAAEATDPDRALLELLEAAADLLSGDPGFVEILRRRPTDAASARQVRDRLLAIVEEPLRRAGLAGLVRRDLRAEDILLALDMLGGAAIAGGRRGESGQERRALELMLDGLR
jgi:AcrR family transcriptional regulator